MKSEILEDRYYIECPCLSPEHLLVFDIYNEIGEWECCIFSASCDFNTYTLWDKIKHCFRFLINSNRYRLNESFLINEGNIDQFEKVVKVMREKCNGTI